MDSSNEEKEPDLATGELITAVDGGSIAEVVQTSNCKLPLSKGRLKGQSAFTLYGCDLSTGRAHIEDLVDSTPIRKLRI